MSENIAICVPSTSHWPAGFGVDLAVLIGTFTRTHGSAKNCFLVNAQISMLPKGRMNLAKEALSKGATHILWLDSDARFPKQTLDQLLAHDLDFVACNAVRRNMPCTPTAKQAPGWRNTIWTMPESYGLEEVHDHVGLHTALIKTDVFKNVPQPWFAMPYMMQMGDYQGEDVWFCHKVLEAGFKIWIDHDLSKFNRHIGMFEFSHDLAVLQRPEFEASCIKEDEERAASGEDIAIGPRPVTVYETL